MKILKIFGLVVGIHLFALFLIFANPGCSSTRRQIPAPSDTVSRAEPPLTVTLPASSGVASGPGGDYSYGPGAPTMFNPDAPAVAAGSSGGGVRFTPTRPGSPAATSLVAEPVADVTPASTYTVVSGDSLWSISKKKGLTVAELAAANGLRANAVLHPGQKLIISGRPASAARADQEKGAVEKPVAVPAKPPASGEYVHVVKRGETLSTIARRYDVSQREIAVRNSITDPQMIPEGKELVIPGWKATDTKAGKDAAKPAGADSGAAGDFAIPATPQPFEIPVIRVDDSPLTPAPTK
ncbi:MAG: LysM peptidoglycan-binding domain-containing protein [Opitutus sp.]